MRSMFGKKYRLPLNNIRICIIDFLLDPLKRQFYYVSTGLRGSISQRNFSLMSMAGDLFKYWLLQQQI